MNTFNHKNGYCLSVNEARIYVEETGAPVGYPVIFLHGGLGSICDYSPFVEKIDTRFRCIGIDTRGHAELHQEIPDAHFFNIPFAGHAAHITHAETVGTFINHFLNRD